MCVIVNGVASALRVELLYRGKRDREPEQGKSKMQKIDDTDQKIIRRIFLALVPHSESSEDLSEEEMRKRIHARLVPTRFQHYLPHQVQTALNIELFVTPLPEYQQATSANLLENIQSSFIRKNQNFLQRA